MLDKAEVLRRVAGLDDSTQRSMICAMVGHSRIVKPALLWRLACARCGTTTHDQLTGIGLRDVVIVGHDCEICHRNYAACTWKDKLLVEDPFVRPNEVI